MAAVSPNAAIYKRWGCQAWLKEERPVLEREGEREREAGRQMRAETKSSREKKTGTGRQKEPDVQDRQIHITDAV